MPETYDIEQKEEAERRKVDHPDYYNRGKIEVIDFIDDQDLNFALGSAIKYICRAGHKAGENPLRDLRKAVWYINHEIEVREASYAQNSMKVSATWTQQQVTPEKSFGSPRTRRSGRENSID